MIARSSLQHLAVDRAVPVNRMSITRSSSSSHQSQPVRQAQLPGAAARHVADPLAGLRVPRRRPQLPSLVVARRLGQHADAADRLALAGQVA